MHRRSAEEAARKLHRMSKEHEAADRELNDLRLASREAQNQRTTLGGEYVAMEVRRERMTYRRTFRPTYRRTRRCARRRRRREQTS